MFCILARLGHLRLLGSAVDVLANTGIHGVPYPLSVPWFDVANSIAVLS